MPGARPRSQACSGTAAGAAPAPTLPLPERSELSDLPEREVFIFPALDPSSHTGDQACCPILLVYNACFSASLWQPACPSRQKCHPSTLRPTPHLQHHPSVLVVRCVEQKAAQRGGGVAGGRPDAPTRQTCKRTPMGQGTIPPPLATTPYDACTVPARSTPSLATKRYHIRLQHTHSTTAGSSAATPRPVLALVGRAVCGGRSKAACSWAATAWGSAAGRSTLLMTGTRSRPWGKHVHKRGSS